MLFYGVFVCLYIVFVYIFFKLVKILVFDGLVFKCYFFMLNKILNIVDCVLNDIV